MIQSCTREPDTTGSITDCFLSVNLGSTLILKACGFIEDHDARIMDVGDNRLHLRIGATRLDQRVLQFLGRSFEWSPMDIHITLQDAEEEANANFATRPHARSTVVHVTLRPVSNRFGNLERFQREGRRLLWQLRSHFIACQ